MIKQIIIGIISICFSTAALADWTGTGFFIAPNGYIATAGHVVKGAKQLVVVYHGKLYRAKVVSTNYENDSAIIKIEGVNNKSYTLNVLPRTNDTVYALGYPLPDQRGYNLKISKGHIRSIGGQLNLAVSVCSGNSGGPAINQSNQVVGVVVSILPLYENGHCSWVSEAESISWIVHMAQQQGIDVNVTAVQGDTVSQNGIYNKAVDNNLVVFIIGVTR